MLSRRGLFTSGVARLVEGLDAVPAEPAGASPPPPAPALRRAWPRAPGADLWAPASEALPRPAGRRLLELDELARHSDAARLQPAALAVRFASREQAVERLVGALGPLAVAPRQPELRARVRQVVDELAVAPAGGMALAARYLLAVAARA